MPRGKLKLMLLGNMGLPRECLFGNTGCGGLIEGSFACAVGNKPVSAGYTKTGAYVDEDRELYAIFRVKCFREFAETNASAPTVQLQIIRAVKDFIAYRKWNFRAMGVSGAFFKVRTFKTRHLCESSRWG